MKIKINKKLKIKNKKKLISIFFFLKKNKNTKIDIFFKNKIILIN
jgi:hypothetical protein